MPSLVSFPADSYNHFLFWLTANINVRFQRVINRAEPGDTLEWLEKVEKTINSPWPFTTSVCQTVDLDSSERTPIEIAQEIITVIA